MQIPRAGGKRSFGWVLKEPLVAYFDYEMERESGGIDDLIDAGIAFRLWTAMFAIEKCLWPVIDSRSPPSSLLDGPWFFKTDPISGEITKTLMGGMDEVSATPEECVVLERAAVWDPEHVIDRLDDHFAGRPNKWVESLKFKPGYDDVPADQRDRSLWGQFMDPSLRVNPISPEGG